MHSINLVSQRTPRTTTKQPNPSSPPTTRRAKTPGPTILHPSPTQRPYTVASTNHTQRSYTTASNHAPQRLSTIPCLPTPSPTSTTLKPRKLSPIRINKSIGNVDTAPELPRAGISPANALTYLKERTSNTRYQHLKALLQTHGDPSPAPPRPREQSEAFHDDLVLVTARKMFDRRRGLSVGRLSVSIGGDADGGERHGREEEEEEEQDERQRPPTSGMHTLWTVSDVSGEELDKVEDDPAEAKEEEEKNRTTRNSGALWQIETDGEDEGEGIPINEEEPVTNYSEETTELMVQKEVSFAIRDGLPQGKLLGIQGFREAANAIIEGLRNARAMVGGFNMTPSKDLLSLSKALMTFLSSPYADTFSSHAGYTFTTPPFIPDDIRTALSKPPPERTETDRRILHSHLTNMRGFQRMPIKMQRELSKILVLETREPGKLIYKQGHYPSSCYGILTGSICLIRTLDDDTKANSNDYSQRTFRLISTLSPGDAFGLDEALSDQSRPATAICKERSELLRIDKWDYQELIDSLRSREEIEKLELIQSHGIFRTLSVGSGGLKRYAEVVTYPPNTVVMGPAEGTNFIHIIKTGQCRVVRDIIFIKTILPDNTYLLSYNDKTPTNDDDSPPKPLNPNQERVTKALIISTLGPSDFFGEESLEVVRDDPQSSTTKPSPSSKITDTPIPIPAPRTRRSSMVLWARHPPQQQKPHTQTTKPLLRTSPRTILTNNRCEILRIPIDDFARFATDATVSYLRHHASSAPSESEAAKEYLKMREWEVYKKKVVRGIVSTGV